MVWTQASDLEKQVKVMGCWFEVLVISVGDEQLKCFLGKNWEDYVQCNITVMYTQDLVLTHSPWQEFKCL